MRAIPKGASKGTHPQIDCQQIAVLSSKPTSIVNDWNLHVPIWGVEDEALPHAENAAER